MTPSSETSLSDMSPATEPTTRPLSKESSSTSKQLTALAQLVQEHYAYTATDANGVHAESSQ